jgi:hypothetical protein
MVTGYRIAGFTAPPLLICALLAAVPARTAAQDVVELERLRIDERGLGRPYLHVTVPGFELFSPFGEQLTRAYALELQRQQALLSVFLPEITTSHYDLPQTILIDDQPPVFGQDKLLVGRSYALPEGVVRQSLNAIRGVPVDKKARVPAGARATLYWSRAVSADSVVSYTSIYGSDYIRQSGKDQLMAAERGLTHVFPLSSLYEHRRPRWPEWVEDGIDALGARFYSEQTLQFFMLVKLAPPPSDLKVEAVLGPRRGEDDAENARLRRQGAAVFIHWALLGTDGTGMVDDHAHRPAFWRFAADATRQPVTEELFVRHFGASAWDAVLEMWTRCAAYQTRGRVPETLGTYWPQTKPTFPEPVIRRATRAELVRVKSEYEWRLGREFASAAPELARQCLDQAGRRLRQAYVDGERDPRFLAVLALFEADGGTPTEARKLVEESAATGVARPRVYFHQARFRFLDEAAKLARPDDRFTLEQARHILAPLETAMAQRPALAEVYRAAAELWLRCAAQPSPGDLEKLRVGLRLFPRDAVLAHHVASLTVAAGSAADAHKIVSQALILAPNQTGPREPLLRLRDAIDKLLPKQNAP